MFDFKSLPEFSKLFPDEQACITFLEKERWGDHVVSPFDPESKVYKCKGNRYKCKTRVNTSMFVQERFLKIQRFHYENGCWLVILLLK